MVRAPTNFWQCRGCKGTVSVSKFSRWRLPTTNQTNKDTARCSVCMDKDTRACNNAACFRQYGSGNASSTSTSKPASMSVDVLCFKRHAVNNVDVPTFWHHDGKQMFHDERCLTCSSNDRLGLWLRSKSLKYRQSKTGYTTTSSLNLKPHQKRHLSIICSSSIR